MLISFCEGDPRKETRSRHERFVRGGGRGQRCGEVGAQKGQEGQKVKVEHCVGFAVNRSGRQLRSLAGTMSGEGNINYPMNMNQSFNI